jgi:hypothetical protein
MMVAKAGSGAWLRKATLGQGHSSVAAAGLVPVNHENNAEKREQGIRRVVIKK